MVTLLDVESLAGRGAPAEKVAWGADPDVIAFGDGNNDVPLLRWAGLGVAMRHGRPAARAAADFVAPEGDPEAGLARAVSAALADGRAGVGAAA